ncbi:MAG TPA: hypothetical protein VI320_22650 [Terracidiphilus sp.]
MKHAPQAIAGYWRWNHALDEFDRLYSKKNAGNAGIVADTYAALLRTQPSLAGQTA